MTSQAIIHLIQTIVDTKLDLSPTSALIGADSIIDSMNLVQICIALEEKSIDEGFNFDWTSEKAMSSLNSILRSPESLAAEYNRQMKISNNT